ncbi:MAG: glycosyltransferase family 4 protein [Pyrinomonadaceae bacterium]
MRVLHYLDSVGRGGAEVLALDVCRNARRFGVDVTIVAGSRGALTDEFAASGVDFIQLERRRPVDLQLVRRLREIVREREIEIVHGHQAVDGLHLYLATRGMPSVRRVLTFHGFVPDLKNKLALKYLIPRMDANVVVSASLRDWLAEYSGIDLAGRSEIIHTAVDPARLEPTGSSIRRELGIDRAAPLIGMIGNFYRDPRKDQATVVRALPAIVGEFPEMHCVFVGAVEPGAEAKHRECVELSSSDRRLAGRVHFTGPRRDVPDILRELDVFVFSSLQEGLPVAAAEAMLAGVPLVVSDIAPLVEATGGGRFAKVFRVGDEASLAAAVRELLDNDERRRGLAAGAREFALENFSIDAHLGRLASLYSSLISR